MKSRPAKRKLVLYSGGNHDWGNERLHKALAQLNGKKVRSFTYVPSTHENGEYYFNKTKKRYKRYGINRFYYFPVDSDFLKREMRKALQSDVIYLAGGNTYYFLKHLRSSGFLDELRKFVKRGGVLAGLSAGALIMTPDIWLAGYPPHEGDINEVRLKNLKGMDLVHFEFLPHYTSSGKTNAAILKYSKKTSRPIIACPDGSGIVVDGEELRYFGPTYLFFQGKKMRLA